MNYEDNNKVFKQVLPMWPCGQMFDINHAMNCKRGGFIIMRHNNLRDFEINLLSKVCKDVESEPLLLPLGGENLPKSTIKGDEAPT